MNMINRLLRFHPIERLSANEALRHPWIRVRRSAPAGGIGWTHSCD